jgi:hypothetical protein
MRQIGNHPGDLKTVSSDCPGKSRKVVKISKKMDQSSPQNRTPKLSTIFFQKNHCSGESEKTVFRSPG